MPNQVYLRPFACHEWYYPILGWIRLSQTLVPLAGIEPGTSTLSTTALLVSLCNGYILNELKESRKVSDFINLQF